MSEQPALHDIPLSRLRQMETMSVRAYNVCNMNGLHTLQAILEFYRRHGTFAKLRNAGRLTEAEMVGICQKYIEQGAVITSDDPESQYDNDRFAPAAHEPENRDMETVFDRFATTWAELFDIGMEDIRQYRQDFAIGRFPLFKFLNDLFSRRTGLSERHLAIMNARYPYTLGAGKRQLDELGAEMNLTRERVRQIALSIPARIASLVRSLGPLKGHTLYEMLQEGDRDLIIIDDTFAAYINAREQVSFTSAFYAVVFEAFLKSTHDRIEEDFDAATDYLVHRSLREVFDFDSYLRRMAARLESRIPESYTLDLDRELEEFRIGDDRTLMRRVRTVCAILAHEEFGIATDTNGNLVMERNTKRRIDEYLADILRERGVPMHVDDLHAALRARLPERDVAVASIRSRLLANEGFARYDHSTYGMREWEEQYSHLKIGSFGDIAERFLQDSDRPRHLSEVADYVMQFRQTNESSVIGTLRADSTGRFMMLAGNMIGLASKDYAGVNLNYRQLNAQVYNLLERLVIDNGENVTRARLIDYCMLHYRMPIQQAEILVDRASRLGRLVVDETGAVAIPNEDEITDLTGEIITPDAVVEIVTTGAAGEMETTGALETAAAADAVEVEGADVVDNVADNEAQPMNG